MRLRIRQLQNAESQARGQIGMYQSRVEAAPMVEQELQGVNREYELEKLRYADLKKRHEAALLEEDDGRSVAELAVIIKPHDYLIPEEPAKIHGISTERALACGMSLKAALAELTRDATPGTAQATPLGAFVELVQPIDQTIRSKTSRLEDIDHWAGLYLILLCNRLRFYLYVWRSYCLYKRTYW